VAKSEKNTHIHTHTHKSKTRQICIFCFHCLAKNIEGGLKIFFFTLFLSGLYSQI